ncbi:hypothetical protein AO265_16355 [Pseudomonas sp. ABAC61]|nr:hypothetical protein AO265_16355 [Pseudomonas sp. ABAC61]
MKRMPSTPRADWQATAEQLGFAFHTFDGEPYWDESAYYQFSLRQIEDDLEDPTQELHELCMALVAEVVESEELLQRLAIYDTPTSLYEASFFQYVWLEQQMQRGQLPAGCDQFNSIEDKLLQAFVQGGFKSPMHFASVRGSLEDRGTVEYLRDIARQAGLGTRLLDVEDIGLDAGGRFVDLLGIPIDSLFKLYPWEHLFNEAFGPAIAGSRTQFVEPPWKAILSNKAAMALLWERHSGHPNLLPAFIDDNPASRLGPGWVRKPFFSREGANVQICTEDGEHLIEAGPYGGPCIRQQFHPLPVFAGNHTVIGSWVIGDRPAGIGIREDNSPITKDSSRFLPHVILD